MDSPSRRADSARATLRMGSVLTMNGVSATYFARRSPPCRLLDTLREAFAKMFKDPEFEEELRKRKWEVIPVSGEELQALAKEVVNQPVEVSAALKRILSE